MINPSLQTFKSEKDRLTPPPLHQFVITFIKSKKFFLCGKPTFWTGIGSIKKQWTSPFFWFYIILSNNSWNNLEIYSNRKWTPGTRMVPRVGTSGILHLRNIIRTKYYKRFFRKTTWQPRLLPVIWKDSVD